MAEPNPFSSLLPTTQNLDLQRRAEFAQDPGDSFWARQAGRAGLDTRRALLEQGIALSPQDERALSTDRIMGGAQKRLAEMVKDGSLDPLDAQEQVINETMQAFMQAGDYTAAQSMLPSLNQIRTYREELNKLRSEQIENVAQAEQAVAGGRLSDTRGRVLEAESPSRIQLNIARAGQADRSPAARAGSVAGGGGGVLKSEQADVRALGQGTMNLFERLADLSTIMQVAPGAASISGQAVNTGGQFLKGIHNFLAGKGSVSASDIESLDAEQQRIVERNMQSGRAQRVAQAQSLGMTVTQYESLVVETAYALARVNDPGGRLSNNDFDYALKQLGAVQDAESAKAAFAAIAQRAYGNYKNRMKTYEPGVAEELYGTMTQNIEAGWKTFESAWGGKTIKDAAKGGKGGSVVADRPAHIQQILDAAGVK